MARRIRKPVWGRSLSRTLGALTRAVLRRGTRTLQRATARAVATTIERPTRPRPPAAAAAQWLRGATASPTGARHYRLFVPPGTSGSMPASLPLLVMLHGCDQDAAAFARSTRMQAIAAREKFLLLFVEQDRLANPHGCWNWFDTRSSRAAAEAASIVAVVEQVCTRHAGDPARVAIAGLSAGASIAAYVALHHPDRFKAVAMHSGVAPNTASSTATAIAAMQGRREPRSLAAGTAPPPLLVIQGCSDAIVRASNGRAAATLWADTAGASAGAPRTVQRGARRAMTVTDFKQRGQIVATLCEVAGLGHAWSGGAANQRYTDPTGPDASRLIWAFAARRFALAGQSAAKQ